MAAAVTRSMVSTRLITVGSANGSASGTQLLPTVADGPSWIPPDRSNSTSLDRSSPSPAMLTRYPTAATRQAVVVLRWLGRGDVEAVKPPPFPGAGDGAPETRHVKVVRPRCAAGASTLTRPSPAGV